MTRIGLFLLILSFATQSFAAQRTRPDCQGDLFSQPSITHPRKPQKQPHFSDLTLMQKQLWDLRSTGPREEYLHLKMRMQNQMMLSKRNQLIGRAGKKNHPLYQIAEVSITVHRNKQWGHPELVAFELNEELGGPLNIPLTVSQWDGALQLWFGYTATPVAYSEQDAQRLWQRVEEDGDLNLFLYLTATHDMSLDKIKMDRDVGLVISDFGNSFYLEEKVNVETLRRMIAQSRFDWKSALNRMDMDKILDLTAFRLSKVQARALQGRLCLLRAILNEEDISFCPKP